ncbi:putative major facilitator superfamily transporter protein [Phaeoacremonium minimum UCRPA7]|uniref:Putative major facilitator superfamily transporter protein n=1 Tax=Phaeoacremonium minimum (strain UCR-PA7) TaxID=1286976 RepID=R8BYG3_PHAM7|nr:putative major facilitator superfamily transporter protein [Phaeoacremonium minimum UCRPA7]EOO04360.1 putative major facilitator superfamily transporter protein [Phaeoacremonium minimum UCRPA7]
MTQGQQAPYQDATNGGALGDAIDQEDSINEQTPLLATKDIAPTADPLVAKATVAAATEGNGSAGHDDEDKPLPVWQIVLLCYARLVEPMAFFSIFPYINKMVQENGGLEPEDVGFYAGLIESLFSLTQAIVMIFWGEAADRIGRKPVLVFSLFGVTLATSIFGMAKTIWQMILFRCLAGVFAGTIVTIRTMIAEHSTQKTQARSFSWFAFSGNLGIFLGPLLGGALADPAGQYPKAFGNIQFFIDYPYALSSFVVGSVGLTGAIAAAVFVKETLKKEPGDDVHHPNKPKRDSHSIIKLVKAPGVGMVLYVYSHIMILAFSYTSLVAIFWYTPVELGGFGFTPLQISIMMAVNGIAQATWLLLIFPPLQHRIGTNGVMRLCAYAYPVFFFLCPLGNLMLKQQTEAAVKAFWVIAPVVLVFGCGISMSFTAIQLAVNDVTPSPQVLGTLNALALTGVSIIRAFTPALFNTLFAVGARTQWFYGYAIWVLMVILAAWFAVVARWLPEKEDLVRERERRRQEQEQQENSAE